MDPVLREQIRAWKAAMDADNVWVLEQKRSRTPEQNLKSLQEFLNGHARYGLMGEKPEARVHKMSYREIQERLSVRSAKGC